MPFEMLDFNMLCFTSWKQTKWVSEKLHLYQKYKNRKRIDLPPCQSQKSAIIMPKFRLGFCVFKKQERQNDQNGTIVKLARHAQQAMHDGQKECDYG